MTVLRTARVFLARAAARHLMVESGEMDIKEAITGLVEPARALFPLYCMCERDTVEKWEKLYPPIRRRQTSLRRFA